MKKFIVIVLVLILIAVFVGCGVNSVIPVYPDNSGNGGGFSQDQGNSGIVGNDDKDDDEDDNKKDDNDDQNNGGDEDDPNKGGNDDNKDDDDDNKDIVPSWPYEFGDEVSKNNTKFYEDYSKEEKDLYYTLWKETTSVSLKIDISAYELKKINEAYVDYVSHGSRDTTKVDTYRKCNLTIIVNGVEYYFEEVGVRMRGNTSRTDFCNERGEIYNYVHLRFAFDETFDGEEYAEGAWASELYHEWSSKDERKARKNRSFATMEKIYYKWNKNYDQTYIREVYANRMFQAYGILAPHITLTQFSIKQDENFENMGVGNLYEVVNKQFIKRNFDKENKGGDLYKCTYTTGRADLTTPDGRGVETPTQRFNYSLKTNDDRTSPDYNHHKYLIALIDALAVDKNSPNFKSGLESIVDMDYFARFEAVNYLLGNPDCIRNNSNNYYLYFTPSGKAYFIPYDYDRCLGANMDWNPSGDGMISAKPFSTDSCCGGVSNPLYRKTILSSGLNEYKELYKNKLLEVLNGDWFTVESYSTLFNAYKNIYAELARPSERIIQSCASHIRAERFAFSLEESEEVWRNDVNISVRKYIEEKRQTAMKNLSY